MPLTAVSVILSDPGIYVPENCAVVAGVLVPAISGANAAITLAVLEFATYIFAPYVAMMTYGAFPPPVTMPLTVAVLVAPEAVLDGAA